VVEGGREEWILHDGVKFGRWAWILVVGAELVGVDLVDELVNVKLVNVELGLVAVKLGLELGLLGVERYKGTQRGYPFPVGCGELKVLGHRGSWIVYRGIGE
jgi:hypothetical protein